MFPDLFRANQPERRILTEPLGIVEILIVCEAAVVRLARQVRHQQLPVRSPRVGHMPFDEFTQSQTFDQLPHEDHTSIGGDSRSLEIDLQQGMKMS